MGEIKARPTLYRGIAMRSRLEADYAAHMDRRGEVWEYEPTCFAGPEGQWLPDFRWRTPRQTWQYQEIKPISLLAHPGDINAVLRKMATAWLTAPELELALVIWEYGTTAPLTFIRGGLYRLEGYRYPHAWFAWSELWGPISWTWQWAAGAGITLEVH